MLRGVATVAKTLRAEGTHDGTVKECPTCYWVRAVDRLSSVTRPRPTKKVCDEIRKVRGGYVVVVRYPYGEYSDGGEVICADFDAVVELLRKAADEPETKERP